MRIRKITEVLLFTLLCAVVALPSQSFAAARKNVTDYFLMLPPENVYGLSSEERAKMLSDFRNDKNYRQKASDASRPFIEICDAPNGYMRLNPCAQGFLEMCFWNTKTPGIRLIAVNGVGESGSKLNFFRHDAKQGTFAAIPAPFKKALVPSDVLRIEKVSSELRGKYAESSKQGNFNFVFYLPRKGKNIEVTAGDSVAYEVGDGVVKKKILKWNGAAFD